MHKGIYAGLLGTVILFSACGYKKRILLKNLQQPFQQLRLVQLKVLLLLPLLILLLVMQIRNIANQVFSRLAFLQHLKCKKALYLLFHQKTLTKHFYFLLPTVPNYKVTILLLAFIKKLIEIICSQLPANKSVPKGDLEALVFIECHPKDRLR